MWNSLNIDHEARLRLGTWSDRPSRCWQLIRLPTQRRLFIMRVRGSVNRSRWYYQHAGVRRDVVYMEHVSFKEVGDRVTSTACV